MCRQSKLVFPKVLKPRNELKLILSKENRKLFEIKKDGNCLFSALSMDKYSNPELHIPMRNRLCDKLQNIFMSEDFKGKWSYETCPSGEALINPEARFVYNFVHNFRYSLFSRNWEVDEEVSLEDRLSYVNKKRNLPEIYDTEEEILAKYSSDIDLCLYGLMEKKIFGFCGQSWLGMIDM